MARTKTELLNDLPSGDSDRKRVKDAINEMVDSILKTTAEKEYQKTVVDVLKEDLKISPKYIKKLAKLRYSELYGDGSVKNELEAGADVVEANNELFNK